MKGATRTAKGGPRDGDGKARTLPKSATRSYETNPAKGKDTGRGTPRCY